MAATQRKNDQSEASDHNGTRLGYAAPAVLDRFNDIFELTSILSRSFFKYPQASLRALLYFFGIKRAEDIVYAYEPRNMELRTLFDLFKNGRFPDHGSLILPNEEAWDDFLVFAHIFARRVKDRLKAGQDVLTKVRWGLTHGIYNAQIHGAIGHDIHLQWELNGNEFRLQLTNIKDEQRMKHHDVSYKGLPISGIGGSLVIMRIAFDQMELVESINAHKKEEILLTLVHRINAKRNSLRYHLALRVAESRDSVQLERIMQKKA